MVVNIDFYSFLPPTTKRIRLLKHWFIKTIVRSSSSSSLLLLSSASSRTKQETRDHSTRRTKGERHKILARPDNKKLRKNCALCSFCFSLHHAHLSLSLRPLPPADTTPRRLSSSMHGSPAWLQHGSSSITDPLLLGTHLVSRTRTRFVHGTSSLCSW